MAVNYLDWVDPIIIGQKIAENYDDDFYILYSGLNSEVRNSKSFIGLFPNQKKTFGNIKDVLGLDINNRSLALFSYESFDNSPLINSKFSHINMPNIIIADFALNIEFDHDKKHIIINYDNKALYKKFIAIINKELRTSFDEIIANEMLSNFTDKSYIDSIKDMKDNILQGNFYQANLTRKFYGNLDKEYEKSVIYHNFIKLCNISPANYSAFIVANNKIIMSSSPELFLEIDGDKVTSRPIKGTINRHECRDQDLVNKIYLQNSPKERAENLMIVDLVRNDLSIACIPGSVKVDKLFNIDTYKMLYHMSSQINGKIKSDLSYFDVIRASFPPGSMTGAPKIAAMQNIAQNERLSRGIYSGSIGIIDKNSAKLSVVIRTLIFEGSKYEFQVGGAITNDSDPYKELQEIYHKARAISEILNIEL